MKKIFIVIICLSCSVLISKAQIPEELARQLEGKKKLSDIMPVVENYYNTHRDENGEEGKESKMMMWARWAEFWSTKLDANGEFTKYTSHILSGNKDILQR